MRSPFSMRIPLIIAFVFLSAVLPAQFLSLDVLQGAWKVESVHVGEDELMMEYHPPRPNDNVWIFEGDTLKQYFYPYKLLKKQAVSLDSNRLFTSGLKWSFASVELDSGKLIVHIPDFLLTLTRTTISGDSLRTLHVLNSDIVNPGALLFTFEMVTHFIPDDAEAYDFNPPVRMPKRISFSDSAEVRGMIRSGTLYLKAGGKKQVFAVAEVEWDYIYFQRGNTFYGAQVPAITLYPKDWPEDQLFRVSYRARVKEVLKRQQRK